MAVKRWNICNVLALGVEARRLWQFDAKGQDFKLGREQTVRGGESLPDVVKKSWSSLWQPKLNVACLPPDRVFLRVAQFPQASFAETLAMVDLQMEKLSPMPVGQVVWTIHLLAHPSGPQQTVILTIAAREAVEQFLGKLEGQGYLADRLELPALDQLLATHIASDGAWIYPEALGGVDTALVAWWYGGVLRSLDLLNLQGAPNRATALREQLSHTAWAGEIEGWLGPTVPAPQTGAAPATAVSLPSPSTPRWHLVASEGTAPAWTAALREAFDEPVAQVKPVPATELAARTAKRAAAHDLSSTLLPAEFPQRYHQQFIDRLWMRGIGAVVLVYLLGIGIYFGILGGVWWRTSTVEQEVTRLSNTYTNALQLRARFNVLQERQELKFAALDCWKLTAEKWPGDATLEGFNFSDGQRLTINGSAPETSATTLLNFNSDMRKAEVNGKPLFKVDAGDTITSRVGANGVLSWNFSLELKRTELQ
jgi:hypothetical protein